jgi:signal recognition particle subunit SRP19
LIYVRGRGKIRLWPAYFDIKNSRKAGRKVPASLALGEPKIEDIEKAAETLGLHPLIELLTYPKAPWKKTGVVLIDKKGSKTEIIMNIARQLRGQ